MDLWEHRQRRPSLASPDPKSSDPEKISGTVENIVYRSEDSGYTVCQVKLDGKKSEQVTVVGNCPAIWIGETLTADGVWVYHKQHGRQFQTQALICVPPTSARGIERYLAGGMIRGVGKVTAERIVKTFGADTLRIIEKESARLQEVEGIGPSKRRAIKESWDQNRGIRDIMIFLQSHGVGSAQSARIYRQYGTNAVNMIRENPYRLCEDVWGIGFKTADRVATSVGVPTESEIRARAGIVYVLQVMMDEGHCYCLAPELILQAGALLEIAPEILAAALNHEIEKGRLVKDQDRIYLPALHAAEIRVARKIKSLMRARRGFDPIDVNRAVPWAEKQMKLTFAPMQAEALKMAMSEKVSIITGGPGVGKTTIIRALVDAFTVRKLKVCMAAPTGRAAKRMEEATHHEAKTLHRLLKYVPNVGRFDHGPDNPLEGQIFILDEVSMMDLLLMDAFLSALPDASCLILVGDVDQLPSVGPGNVLMDFIQSDAIPFKKLETIFRQEKGGWIVRNAHLINKGEHLETPAPDEDADFYFIQTQEPEQVIQRMLELVTSRIPKRFGFDPMNDIQVLTPMRRNELGADNLNVVLQEALNPKGTHVERFGRKYREGDRVMQIRNNYDKDVFNGDIGRIVHVDMEDQKLTVNFDGRKVPFDFSELDEIIHAYACSIHKSQGSEYPAVVILITTQHFKLLQRNLLYTGITRGRKLVCLVGSSKAVHIAIKNNEIRLRRTGLRERLAIPGDRRIVLDDAVRQ